MQPCAAPSPTQGFLTAGFLRHIHDSVFDWACISERGRHSDENFGISRGFFLERTERYLTLASGLFGRGNVARLIFFRAAGAVRTEIDWAFTGSGKVLYLPFLILYLIDFWRMFQHTEVRTWFGFGTYLDEDSVGAFFSE